MSTEPNQEDVQVPANFEHMSDEDFLNFDVNSLPADDAGGPQEGAPSDGEEDPNDEPTDPAADPDGDGNPEADADREPADDPAESDDPESDGPEGEDDEGEEPLGDDSPESDDPEGEEGDGEEKEKDGEEEETEPEKDAVDYKAEYEKLLKPFKANGREIKIDSVDDAIQLMQMGANYNKKMAALKPSLKTLKLLENNNLLDDEKLSYLIDLDKKNPEAIKKLVKDSGIDPLDINTEEESEYTPKIQTVDDSAIELDAVLDEIQDTPTYSKTISLVGNQWDKASKQAVADEPQLLKVINDHMQLGIYDRISAAVEKDRMLGRLNGLSDLEAYQRVGDALHAKGEFADLVGTPQPAPEAKPEPKKTVVSKPKAEDPKRKSKKRAASSTRQAAASKPVDPNFNPLALSDEDFDKLVNERLM